MPEPVAHRFIALDALRGVAALIVVQRHAGDWYGGAILPGGYLAVDLFFLLSGFVLAYAYDVKLASGMGWAEFMWRRLSRLYPLYLLGFALTVVAFVTSGSTNWWRMAAGLFFLPEFWQRDFRWFVPSSWSLFFELAINLLWGVFHRYLTSIVLLIVVLVGLIAVVASALYFGGLDGGFRGKNVVSGFARVFFSFPLGVLIYRYRAAFDAINVPGSGWIACAALIGIAALPGEAASRPGVDLAIVTVILPVLVIFAARPVRVDPLSVRIFSALGALSYAIYVLHGTSLSLIERAWPSLIGVGVLVPTLIIAALAAVALFLDRFYDIPIRRFLARWPKRHKIASEAPT